MGNQPCCVSSLRRDQMYPEFFCNSPPSSNPIRNVHTASNNVNPQTSQTLGDQLTDLNSVFYRPLNTDYPAQSTLTPEEEAKALASKKKKKLRKKKPPPLNNIESPREYTATSNTFYLTNNYDRTIENYTDPSYKITTTQGEIGVEGHEDLSKKIGTEYWENVEEEEEEDNQNLSVRLSDKRKLDQLELNPLSRGQLEAFKQTNEMLSAGMIAQKVGEDECHPDNEIDEDEIQFDPLNQESFRNDVPSKPNNHETYQIIVPKKNQPLEINNEQVIPAWDGRQSVVHEEPDASLVHVNPYSYSSNPRNKLVESNSSKDLKGERTTTEETTRRYNEYRVKIHDNTSTAVKQNTGISNNLLLPKSPGPFNVSDGAEEEPTIRVPEKLYEASVVHFSHDPSPQKRQASFLKYEDSLYSADQSGKNAWDAQQKSFDLSAKNNGETPVGGFLGTFGNAAQKEILKQENYWMDHMISFTSQMFDHASPLRERSIIANDKAVDFSATQDNLSIKRDQSQYRVYEIENRKKDLSDMLAGEKNNRNSKLESSSQNYKIHKPGNSNAEASERWESVQTDVQKLIDNAFKPKASLIDSYLKSMKDDTRKSGIYKPKVSWKEQLEARTEYTNPFAEEKRGSVVIGYDSKNSGNDERTNKNQENFSSQERRSLY